MMLRQEALLELVDNVYEAALRPGCSARISTLMNTVFKGEMTNLIEQSIFPLDGHVVGHSGQDPFYTDRFNTYFSKKNPWVRRFSNRTAIAEVLLSDSMMSAEEMERTEFYCDYMRKQNLYYWMGIMTSFTGDAGRIFTISRGKNIGPYTKEDVSSFNILSPHIVRALQLSHHVADLELKSKGLAESMNQLRDGVVLLSRDRSVLEVNDSAQKILSMSDGLVIRDKQLTAIDKAVNQRIKNALSSLVSQETSLSAPTDNVFRISRPSKKAAFIFTAIRLPSTVISTETTLKQTPTVIVFLNDPDSQLTLPERFFTQLWQFTKSECQVALMLLNGMEPCDIAQAMFVSKNTIRTHLKRIMDKSGTHRQGEFIATAYKSLTKVLKEENQGVFK
jgi:DNA-binding CsgD family transcriptional regulator